MDIKYIKYIKIWDAVQAMIFELFTTEGVNKGKFINPKLNMYGDKVQWWK